MHLQLSALEIEADLVCTATQFWSDAVWTGRWDEDLEKCGMKTGVRKPPAGSRYVDQRVRCSAKQVRFGNLLHQSACSSLRGRVDR